MLGAAETIRAIATPGHTDGSITYVWNGYAFTGDALFVDGCGRTDFQDGDAGRLYDSVTQRLFALPDETVVFPAHDYHGQQASTIGYERRHNARFAGRSRADFIGLMAHLDLPKPKLMDVAVPANRKLGVRE
jgi:glyoxylase-like metal-dependent hydrolase (beta-lactamase superfamily II)